MANFDFLSGLGSGLSSAGSGILSLQAMSKAEKLEKQRRQDKIAQQLSDRDFRDAQLAQTAGIAEDREAGMVERENARIAAGGVDLEARQLEAARQAELERDYGRISDMTSGLQESGIYGVDPDITRQLTGLSPSVPPEEGADVFDRNAMLERFASGRASATESGNMFAGEGFYATPPKVSRSETTTTVLRPGDTVGDRAGEANEFLKRLEDHVSSYVSQILSSLRTDFTSLPPEQVTALRRQAAESFINSYGGVQGYEIDEQGNLYDSKTGETKQVNYDAQPVEVEGLLGEFKTFINNGSGGNF